MEARQTWHFDTGIFPGFFLWHKWNIGDHSRLAIPKFMDSQVSAEALWEEMRSWKQ